MKSKEELSWKMAETKFRAKETGAKILNWCVQHPILATTLIGAGVSLTTSAINQTGRTIRKKLDYDREYKRIWDGHYQIPIKHKLDGQEYAEVARRRKDGEAYVDILNDMHLLK